MIVKRKRAKARLRFTVLRLQAPAAFLGNIGSEDFGLMRHRDQMIFFVGGITVSRLGAIEVKAVASCHASRAD